MPASVRQHLQETMKTDNFEARFQLLFALAHLPGIFLPFVAGRVTDCWDGPSCLLMLSTTCLAGALVSAMGVQQEAWSIIIFGRFIFGLGFESLFVANQAFLATCFEPDRLGMALGVSSAASYAGYLLSFILSPTVANRTTVAGSFWFAALVKSVGTLAAIVLYWQYHACTQKQSTMRCGSKEGASEKQNIFETTWGHNPDLSEASHGDFCVPQPQVSQNDESTDDEPKTTQATPAPQAANTRPQMSPSLLAHFDLPVWLLCLLVCCNIPLQFPLLILHRACCWSVIYLWTLPLRANWNSLENVHPVGWHPQGAIPGKQTSIAPLVNIMHPSFLRG